MRPAGYRSSLFSALLGAVLWGLSGTAAQGLFQGFHFPVLGLVAVRMLSGGGILLLVHRPSRPHPPLMPLVIFSILGFAGSQLTYLFAIQFSNAATATLLQFLFLPMVAGYEALTGALKWSVGWSLTLLLAAIGTILLIGGVSGSSFQILITPAGLLFGLLAAVCGAYYTLASRPLVRVHGPWFLTTWGFVIGGLVMLPFGAFSFLNYAPPSSLAGNADVLFLVAFVIIFGTILGYGLYLSGLRRLSATEIGIAASIEPISATIAAYAFLGVALTTLQYLGGALILVAVILVASQVGKSQKAVGQPYSSDVAAK
ncbi:MAG TPA: EamA family transporter [Nitrososphaerales archaeon]|nr:EamA family transporter [Nitrososphaerales archaeon]